MNKNINTLLNSLQDLDAFSDELERLEGEEYEKGLWDSTRPYSDVYDGLHMLYNYFPKTKEELREIIKERLIDAKQEDPNKIVNLNDIDVSEITDMSALFCFDDFMQEDDEYVFNNVDISEWNVSNVENMSYMFIYYDNFNCDLSRWKVSNVKDMCEMFWGCSSFNSDLSGWKVSKVEDMRSMFAECTSFKSDLSEWNVSNVKNMSGMFRNCKEFNSDLSGWDVSNVEEMCEMFQDCKEFNCDLSKWKNKVSKVKNMDCMFYNCTSFNSDLSEWDVSKVSTSHGYFNYYDVVDKNGNFIGRSTLPNLPNEKCPKWKNNINYEQEY